MKLRTQQFPHISDYSRMAYIPRGHLSRCLCRISHYSSCLRLKHNKGICCSRAIYSVLQNPYDIEAKLSLARWYWQNGQKLNAIRETDIVRDMLGSTSMPKTNSDSLVLGTMTSKLEETLLAFHPAPPIANTEESFWKKLWKNGRTIGTDISYLPSYRIKENHSLRRWHTKAKHLLSTQTTPSPKNS